MYPCGLVISSLSPWIAATPDKKVFCPSFNPPQGLLEIKCPVNPLANCMYLKRHENGHRLKDTYKYYYQMITRWQSLDYNGATSLRGHLRSPI